MKPVTRHRHGRLSALVATTVIAGSLGTGCDKSDRPPPTSGDTPAATAPAPSPATAPKPAFDRLKGQWRRADGGYLLEIRAIQPGGNMDVTYANPQPINVAKARASLDGTTAKVFVELRDANYPGCTYALTHTADDRLVGIYFQAALQQQFEVVFERVR